MDYKKFFHKKLGEIHPKSADKLSPKNLKRISLRLLLDVRTVFRDGVLAQVEDVGDFLHAEGKI